MPVSKDARDFGRSEVRYRLYRIQSEKPVEKDGLKAHYESQAEFDGWHNFAKTWDVGEESTWPDGHFVVVPLRESWESKWQKTLLGLAEDPPEVEADDTCKGTNTDGDSCGNKARESGYCYLHEGTTETSNSDDSEIASDGGSGDNSLAKEND